MLVKLALRYLAEVRIILPEIRGGLCLDNNPGTFVGGARTLCFR